MKKKKIAPLWMSGDMLYHYSDNQRAIWYAEDNNTPVDDVKLVWVIMDADYFVGTVQRADQFEGMIFVSESGAEKHLNDIEKLFYS